MVQPLLVCTTLSELATTDGSRLIAVRLSTAIGLTADGDAIVAPWEAADCTALLPWSWTAVSWKVMTLEAGLWRAIPQGAAGFSIIAPPPLANPNGAAVPGPQAHLEGVWRDSPPVLGRLMRPPGGPTTGEIASRQANGHSLMTRLESLAAHEGSIALNLSVVALIAIAKDVAPPGQAVVAAPAFTTRLPGNGGAGYTVGYAPISPDSNTGQPQDMISNGPAATPVQTRIAWTYTAAAGGAPPPAGVPDAIGLVRPITTSGALDDQWRSFVNGHATHDWQPHLPDLAAAALDLPSLLYGATTTEDSIDDRLIGNAAAAFAGPGIDVGLTDDIVDQGAVTAAARKAALLPPAMPLLRLGLAYLGRQPSDPLQRPDASRTTLSPTLIAERAETLLAGLGAYWQAQGLSDWGVFGPGDAKLGLAAKPPANSLPQFPYPPVRPVLTQEDTARRVLAIWAEAGDWAARLQPLATGPVAYWTALDRAAAAPLPPTPQPGPTPRGSIVRGLIDLSIGGRRPTPQADHVEVVPNEAPIWVLVAQVSFQAAGALEVTLVRPDLGQTPYARIPLGAIARVGADLTWTPSGGAASTFANVNDDPAFFSLVFDWREGDADYGYRAALSDATRGPTLVVASQFGAGAALGRGHYVEFGQSANASVGLVRAATTAPALAEAFPPDASTLMAIQPRRLLARAATARALRSVRAGARDRAPADYYAGSLPQQALNLLQALCGSNAPVPPHLEEQATMAAGAVFRPYLNSTRTPPGQAANYPTADAAPLVLDVNSGSADDVPTTSEMIGYGLLAQRTGGGASGLWRSLNAATASWPTEAAPPATAMVAVDPVGLRGGAASGPASFAVRYDGRPLIGAQSSEASDVRGIVFRSPAAAISAFQQPGADAQTIWPVPLPRFGDKLSFAAYAIGPGGVLPRELRAGPNEPFKLIAPLPAPPATSTLSAAYLRTVPIGAPRIDKASPAIPALPTDFVPLAGELRDQPAPFRLPPNSALPFYRTRDGTSGLIQLTSWRFDVALLNIVARATVPTPYSLLVALKPLGPAAAGAGYLPPVTITLTVGPPMAAWSGSTLNVSLPSLTTPTPRLDVGLSFTPNNADGTVSVAAIVYRDLDNQAYASTMLKPAVTNGRLTPMPPPAPGAALPGPTGAYMVEVSAPATNQADLLFEPPVVSLATRPMACPEAAHPKPAPLTLYGGRDITVLVRPPAVTYRTWSRSVAAADMTRVVDKVKRAIDSLPAGADASLDDPAVQGFHVELVRQFPDAEGAFFSCEVAKQTALRPGAPLQDVQAPSTTFLLKRLTGAPPAATPVVYDPGSGTCTVSVPEGEIHELRIYPRVRATDFAASATSSGGSLAPVLAQGALAAVDPGASPVSYLLGAPLRYLIEAAPTSTPDFVSGNVELQVKAVPGAPSAMAAVLSVPEAMRVDMRRVLIVTPSVQRWTWSGAPLLSYYDWPLPGLPPPPPLPFAGLSKETWMAIAYAGRTSDDALDLPPVRLRRGHLTGRTADTRFPSDLFQQPTPQTHGAGHWRAAVRFQSRYESLGEITPSERQTSFADDAASLFTPAPEQASLGVPTSADLASPLPRLPLDLALPLTASAPKAKSELPPPLMLMFDGPSFPDGDLTDRLEVGLDVARHPLPVADQPRNWPQGAPDARLTTAAHDGSPLAMRVIGPIGWTEDAGASRPRYARSSMLLQFLAPPSGGGWDAGGAWPMIKIRTRRFQDPVTPVGALVTPVAKAAWPPSPEATHIPAPPPPPPPAPAPAPKGDQPLGAGVGALMWTTLLDGRAELILAPTLAREGVPLRAWRLIADRAGGVLTVGVAELLPRTEPPQANDPRMRRLTLPLSADDQAGPIALRVIVGARPPGFAVDGAKTSTAWDISAAVLRRSDQSSAVTDGSSGWITLPIMTLDAGPQDTCTGALTIAQASAGWQWAPIRLSACSDGLWVQFVTDAGSLLVINGSAAPSPRSTSEFAAAVVGGVLTLNLPDPPGGPRALRPRTITDATQSAPAALYALVTTKITDAAGQPAERAIGVFPIGSWLAGGWTVGTAVTFKDRGNGGKPTTVDYVDEIGKLGGRLRFLTIEERPAFQRADDDQSPFSPLSRLFEGTPQDGDAFGRVIAISPPIEISTPRPEVPF